MAIYKIVSIFVDADEMPANYTPFITTEKPNRSSLLRIRRTDLPEYIPDAEIIASLDIIDIKRSQSIPDSWIYQFNKGIGTLIVNDDYSYAECRFSRDGVSKDAETRVLDSLVHLAIQCKLIHEGYTVLHAACICKNEEAFAFSGHSGIGKSTRASLWINCLEAEWISGDRPVIEPLSSMVFGAPWDGEDKIFKNIRKSLKAVLKVERSHETVIEEMAYWDKFRFLTEQIFIPMWDKELAAKAFSSMKQVINHIPIYLARCDRTESSMKELYRLLQDKITI